MSNQPHPATLDLLRAHFDAQRASAFRLIEGHNRLLSRLLGNTLAQRDIRPRNMPDVGKQHPAATAPAEGKIVSLFDYSKTGSGSEAVATQQAPDNFIVFSETDHEARSRWGKSTDKILARFGADDALAVNRKHLASMIFMTMDQSTLFFFKSESGVMFVVCYAGPDDHFGPALTELRAYADANTLQINMMAHENRAEALQKAGFSTTPLGIWQRIDPLSAFTMDGQKMRRLRYLVKKYTKGADCETREYCPGTDSDTDRQICDVIDRWVELKETEPPFVNDVKKQVLAGSYGEEHRFFLTGRNGKLDNVMVFSRDNLNDGYLMDLEFYGRDMPLGSTEYALSQIIALFAAEDRRLVSLGLTMGTGLFEHENGAPEVHKLFEQLRNADYLNGDANAQYKNKYRPVTTTMYLARPAGAGNSKLNDLMLLLGSAN